MVVGLTQESPPPHGTISSLANPLRADAIFKNEDKVR